MLTDIARHLGIHDADVNWLEGTQLMLSALVVPAFAILLGRLCLYGPGAARLHEEIIPITARWTDPKIRKSPLTPYAREAEAKARAGQLQAARSAYMRGMLAFAQSQGGPLSDPQIASLVDYLVATMPAHGTNSRTLQIKPKS